MSTCQWPRGEPGRPTINYPVMQPRVVNQLPQASFRKIEITPPRPREMPVERGGPS